MGIQVVAWDGRRVALTAPLEPNRNDKGTGFAGSIDALLDLAGWSAITLALRDAGIGADVMIVKSETEYRAAVRGDMKACASISSTDRDQMIDDLMERGRSKIHIVVRVESENKKCAAMTAHYAILKR